MLSIIFAPSTISGDRCSKSWIADIWVDYLIVWRHSYGIRALEFSRLNTQGVIISRSLCVVAETCSVLLCVHPGPERCGGEGGEAEDEHQEDEHQEVTGKFSFESWINTQPQS